MQSDHQIFVTFSNAYNRLDLCVIKIAISFTHSPMLKLEWNTCTTTTIKCFQSPIFAHILLSVVCFCADLNTKRCLKYMLDSMLKLAFFSLNHSIFFWLEFLLLLLLSLFGKSRINCVFPRKFNR